MAVWIAEHDNGWITAVIENLDGTYSASAAPTKEQAAIDYLKDDPEHARIAAEYALKRKTGHQCSERCSGWTRHRDTRVLTRGNILPKPVALQVSRSQSSRRSRHVGCTR